MQSRDRTVVRALAFHQCVGYNSQTQHHYVGWVCCWFSSLLRECFPNFQIPIQSGIWGPQVYQLSDCQVSPSLNKVNLEFFKWIIYIMAPFSLPTETQTCGQWNARWDYLSYTCSPLVTQLIFWSASGLSSLRVKWNIFVCYSHVVLQCILYMCMSSYCTWYNCCSCSHSEQRARVKVVKWTQICSLSLIR